MQVQKCFKISKEYHIISTYIAVYQFILFISTCINKINSFNKISTYINIFHVCPLKLSALMCLYIFQHFSFTVFWHSFNMVFCLSTLFHYYFNINFNIISTSFAKQYFNIISTCISTVFQHISLIWISTFHISTYLIRQVHWCYDWPAQRAKHKMGKRINYR